MWDIKFNPAKSQVITFGGRQPQSITITLDDAAIHMGQPGEISWLLFLRSVLPATWICQYSLVNFMDRSTKS